MFEAYFLLERIFYVSFLSEIYIYYLWWLEILEVRLCCSKKRKSRKRKKKSLKKKSGESSVKG